MDEDCLKRKEKLLKETQGLLNDFGKKRKIYAVRTKGFQISLICIGAMTSLVIGLSFIDGIAFVCRVIGLVLTAMTTIVTGILSVCDYEEKWRQRSVTYLKLLALKRDLNLEGAVTEEKFAVYWKRLDVIMEEDANLWFADFDAKQKEIKELEKTEEKQEK